MEKFRVKQERTYTTWLTIEAETRDEAEKKYWQMMEDGEAYHQELKQMDVGDETYTIYRTLENGRNVTW
jgi:hypothetical protein